MEQHKERRLRESVDHMDLVRMQTEHALFVSMTKSKALTIMVLVAVILIASISYLLFS